MGNDVTKHTINIGFEVELERDDNEEEDRRYRANCFKLAGCQVYANSDTQAVHKIKQAIEVWIELANRQFGDNVNDIQETIELLLRS